MVDRISQFRILLIPLVLGLSGCQTIDEAPTSSAWNYVPSTRTNEPQSRYDRTNSTPLLANTRGGQSMVIEGSGRFVGEPPTGAILDAQAWGSEKQLFTYAVQNRRAQELVFRS